MTTLTVPELLQWIAKAGEAASSADAGAAAAAMELAARCASRSSAAASQARKDLQAAIVECPDAFRGAVVLLQADSLDAGVQKAAATIVRGAVFQHPSNASSFLGCEGALDSLANLLSSSNAGILEQAVWSLWGLSTAGSTACVAIVAHAGILRCLPLLLADPYEDVGSKTASLVEYLADGSQVISLCLARPT
jgi:guanyl-specific ribonuclease Sa